MSDATTIDAFELDPPPDGEEGSRAYLIVRDGERTAVVDLHEGDEIVVGRSSEATIQLDDARVSREHARIRRGDGGLVVLDLGGRNGTQVNEERLHGTECHVVSGDVIRIGGAELTVAGLWPRLRPAGVAAATDEVHGAGADRSAPPPVKTTAPGEELVVADAAMVRVFHVVQRLALTPTSVLILGETGVGKEVVAEQIHQAGRHARGPFIALNCGSITETLLESELFGHERGAFTGAEHRRIGHLESAHGGTLFLDEVGELRPMTQTKLLRVIETRRFTRLGGQHEIDVDLRLISATHRDLEAEVTAGRFRQDLYFRLAPFVLHVPPLRERPSEIALLAELFARRLSQAMGAPPPLLDRSATDALRRHAWPGNVRELRNAIEHALVLAEDGVIRAEHLPGPVAAARNNRTPTAAPAVGSIRESLATLERAAIVAALEAEAGNQTKAARRLGISRRALLYKMEKFRLQRS